MSEILNISILKNLSDRVLVNFLFLSKYSRIQLHFLQIRKKTNRSARNRVSSKGQLHLFFVCYRRRSYPNMMIGTSVYIRRQCEERNRTNTESASFRLCFVQSAQFSKRRTHRLGSSSIGLRTQRS